MGIIEFLDHHFVGIVIAVIIIIFLLRKDD